MKWFKRILIGAIALLLLFAAVGLALPSRFRIERSVTIAAPAEKVYPPDCRPGRMEALDSLEPARPEDADRVRRPGNRCRRALVVAE
jgi:hypothetical protein